MKQTLILGIGNEILTDDGIGPRIVAELQKKEYHKNIRFQNASIGGLEILELISGYQMVIFIDAIITRNGLPGTVYHFTPDDFKETLHLSNFHDANFLTALALGKKMNMSLPSCIHIIAVEIIEDHVFSTHFSPEIDLKFNDIVETVIKIIHKLTKNSKRLKKIVVPPGTYS